jgi:hypothetical protein
MQPNRKRLNGNSPQFKRDKIKTQVALREYKSDGEYTCRVVTHTNGIRNMFNLAGVSDAFPPANTRGPLFKTFAEKQISKIYAKFVLGKAMVWPTRE